MSTQSPGQQALAALNTFFDTVGTDALTDFAGPLDAFGASLQTTPTETNLIAQAILVPNAVLAEVPTLESQGIAAAGVAIQAIVAAAKANATAAAAKKA